MRNALDITNLQFKADRPSCRQRWRLKELGYSEEEIQKMTKKKAYDTLASHHSIGRWIPR
ncbi:hypothetical protein [Vibrio phage Va2]|nr:hypothetical protein [Vibrio phage Va2]